MASILQNYAFNHSIRASYQFAFIFYWIFLNHPYDSITIYPICLIHTVLMVCWFEWSIYSAHKTACIITYTIVDQLQNRHVRSMNVSDVEKKSNHIWAPGVSAQCTSHNYFHSMWFGSKKAFNSKHNFFFRFISADIVCTKFIILAPALWIVFKWAFLGQTWSFSYCFAVSSNLNRTKNYAINANEVLIKWCV